MRNYIYADAVFHDCANIKDRVTKHGRIGIKIIVGIGGRSVALRSFDEQGTRLDSGAVLAAVIGVGALAGLKRFNRLAIERSMNSSLKRDLRTL